MLTPATDLVVAELGVCVPERRRLGVLVHVALPPVGRDRAERAAAVDQRDGAAETAGDLTRGVGRTFDLFTARPATSGELLLGLDQQRLRVGHEADAVEGAQERRDEGAERGARQETLGAGHDRRCPVEREGTELTTRGDGDEVRTGIETAPRHRERLLGVTGVRQREHQGARAHERGSPHLLQHGHGNRQLTAADHIEHVARDARSTHPDHDDVVDLVDRRKG